MAATAGTEPPARAPRALNLSALLLALIWLAFVFLGLDAGTDDFRTYWQAAANLQAGGDPYRMAEAGAGGIGTGYFYPPVFATLLQPLAALDHATAQRLWFGLNVVAFIANVALCIRLSGSALARRFWGVVTLLFALFVPTRLNLHLGQISLFMALALIVPATAAARPALSGALLALAVTTRIFPALMALPLLLWRQWRELAWTAAWGCALAALVLALHGEAPFRAFLALARDGTVPYPFQADHNVSLYGFLARLLAAGDYSAAPLADLPWLVAPLAALLGAIVVGFTALATRRGTDRAIGVSAWLCALMLVSPTNGSYALSMLLLPTLALLRAYERRREPWIRHGLVLCGLVCNLPPTWAAASLDLYLFTHTGAGLLLATPQLYGLIGYLVLLLRLAREADAGDRVSA